MAGSVKVHTRVMLYEATDTRNNTRTTLLTREDRPDVAVPFGSCIEDDVRCMIECAERRRNLCQWYFAEAPIGRFTELTKLGEFALILKEK